MSDIVSQGLQNLAGTGEPEGTETQEQGQGIDSLAAGFLANIPDTDRPIVEKYVKDWDAGVTKKFQEIHGTYEPFKALGDLESLQQAVSLAELIDTNPQYVYGVLADALKEQGIDVSAQQLQQQQQQGGGQNPVTQPTQLQVPPELSAHLTPLQEQLATQNKMIEQMAQILVQSNNQTREQQEDQALNSFVEGLKEKHGNFDEEAVLLKIMNGKDGDTAVQEWKDGVLSAAKELGFTTNQGPKLPPSLSSGSVPSSQTSVNELDSKQTRDLVSDIMQMASQQQQ